MNKSKSGFTIVELLIVIVVIAILAAISIVAYNGVQNRANDVVIQNDLSQMAKQMQAYTAVEGQLATPSVVSAFSAVGIKATKSAYGAPYTEISGAEHNLLFCSDTTSGSSKFVIIAGSKSGKVFIYSSETGASSTTDPLVSRNTLCPRYDISSHNSAWMYSYDTWRAGV